MARAPEASFDSGRQVGGPAQVRQGAPDVGGIDFAPALQMSDKLAARGNKMIEEINEGNTDRYEVELGKAADAIMANTLTQTGENAPGAAQRAMEEYKKASADLAAKYLKNDEQRKMGEGRKLSVGAALQGKANAHQVSEVDKYNTGNKIAVRAAAFDAMGRAGSDREYEEAKAKALAHSDALHKRLGIAGTPASEIENKKDISTAAGSRIAMYLSESPTQAKKLFDQLQGDLTAEDLSKIKPVVDKAYMKEQALAIAIGLENTPYVDEKTGAKRPMTVSEQKDYARAQLGDKVSATQMVEIENQIAMRAVKRKADIENEQWNAYQQLIPLWQQVGGNEHGDWDKFARKNAALLAASGAYAEVMRNQSDKERIQQMIRTNAASRRDLEHYQDVRAKELSDMANLAPISKYWSMAAEGRSAEIVAELGGSGDGARARTMEKLMDLTSGSPNARAELMELFEKGFSKASASNTPLGRAMAFANQIAVGKKADMSRGLREDVKTAGERAEMATSALNSYVMPQMSNWIAQQGDRQLTDKEIKDKMNELSRNAMSVVTESGGKKIRLYEVEGQLGLNGATQYGYNFNDKTVRDDYGAEEAANITQETAYILGSYGSPERQAFASTNEIAGKLALAARVGRTDMVDWILFKEMGIEDADRRASIANAFLTDRWNQFLIDSWSETPEERVTRENNAADAARLQGKPLEDLKKAREEGFNMGWSM